MDEDDEVVRQLRTLNYEVRKIRTMVFAALWVAGAAIVLLYLFANANG